jgi:hypothetical protein
MHLEDYDCVAPVVKFSELLNWLVQLTQFLSILQSHAIFLEHKLLGLQNMSQVAMQMISQVLVVHGFFVFLNSIGEETTKGMVHIDASILEGYIYWLNFLRYLAASWVNFDLIIGFHFWIVFLGVRIMV